MIFSRVVAGFALFCGWLHGLAPAAETRAPGENTPAENVPAAGDLARWRAQAAVLQTAPANDPRVAALRAELRAHVAGGGDSASGALPELVPARVEIALQLLWNLPKTGDPPAAPDFPFSAELAARYLREFAAWAGLPVEVRARDGAALRLIPPGEFIMGAPDAERGGGPAEFDETPHPARLTRPFYLARTETTVGAFRRFVEDSKHVTDGERAGGGHAHDERAVWKHRRGVSWRRPYHAGSFELADEHPVTQVSHNDCQAYAAWLRAAAGPGAARYALPTEAEWEWACRAGAATRYWWGDADDDTGRRLNAGDAALKRTHPEWPRAVMPMEDGHPFAAPVGRYQANPFGLHDMLGNVWEFCGTRYGVFPRERTIDPGHLDLRRGFAVRGGGWSNAPTDVRCGARNADPPEFCHSNLGFRLALRFLPAEATHAVLLRPIVLSDDAGGTAAPCRLSEAALDEAFASARLDFQVLEPIPVRDEALRTGKLAAADAVARLRRAGAFSDSGLALHVVFASALPAGAKQDAGASGAAREGPVITSLVDEGALFVALGAEAAPAAEDEAFARNVRRCLGLADDDGQTVAWAAISEDQTRAALASPWTRASVRCLPVEEARRVFADESYGAFFGLLEAAEIAAFTGRPAEGADSNSRRAAALTRFQEALRPWTDREEAAVLGLATRVRKMLADERSLVAAQPWWFVKVDAALCGGASWTRGPCIVLSQRTVGALADVWARDPDAALGTLGRLLAHEQLHVAQRLYPGKFHRLHVEVFGYERATPRPHPWLTERQVTNPDGPDTGWIARVTGTDGVERRYWPRALLKTIDGVPAFGRDFENLAIALRREGDALVVVERDDGSPQRQPLAALAGYAERVPGRAGLDHPHELAAYLFAGVSFTARLEGRPPATTEATRAVVEGFEQFLRTELLASER